MKAIVQDRYGSPVHLRLADVDKPVPAEDQVLVRVRAASANAGDWRRVRGRPFLVRTSEGLRRPKEPVLGVDAAGVVEEVGANVTDLRRGDEVYGMRQGAFAEYVAGRSFVRKPQNLSFEAAAAVPAAGCTALQAVRDRGKVQPGERVLVNGAGGGVGTFLVQLAKAFGADVTAVTRTDALELVGSLGADHVIDYTAESFTRRPERYDVIIDVGGTPSLGVLLGALVPGGRLVIVGAGKGPLGPLGRFAAAYFRRLVRKQEVIGFIAAPPFDENLDTLRELIEAGQVRPVIDRTYPLGGVPEAMAAMEREEACGKIVITV